MHGIVGSKTSQGEKPREEWEDDNNRIALQIFEVMRKITK